MYTRIMGTNFTLIKEDENQIEVSFTSIWNMSLEGKHVPLNIDRRFIMLSDCSGFYSYAIYEHLEGWPDFDLTQTRIAFKLREDMFQYMAISDERQRMMPLPEDRLTGLPLSYPEAVLLTNPTNPYFMGEVDDKYQYSSDNKDDRVHGWISSYPAIGFWIITPSDEFRAGGPFKQDLTCHVGPISLAMLMEVQRWPYDFPVSEDFLCSDQRGTVSGRLLVQTNDSEYMRVDAAYVGLAPSGEVGSWQRESKGYQFWTKTDTNGSFSIVNARAGDYNLFAWVPGFIGDFRYHANLTVSPGCDINLGNIVYEPPRDGPTLWEIGIPDRSASEFYIPDPNPKYINKLYSNHLESDGYTLSSLDKFRQYGLWERYTDLYPDGDLIYTVGASFYGMDWFFAQFIRMKEDGTFQATTWQIKFKLEDVNETGTYTLRLALASAAKAELQLLSYLYKSRRMSNKMSEVVEEQELPQEVIGWAARDSSEILSPFKFQRRATGAEDLTLKVLYCGLCHSDIELVKNNWGLSVYPLVPGHEIVGIVVEVGFKVENFKVGDKIGIGLLVSSCQTCEDCSNSLECYCPKFVASCNGKCNDDGTTVTSYGGFSDIMVANMRYVVHIPDNLPLDGSAPLLCAGITVYSPMKYYGLTDPGMHVGVVGLGGLGHLAVKFAKAFGVKVTVISTSLGKKEEAIQRLGADSFLLSSDSEQLKAAIGTMDGIIDTVSSVHSLYPLIALLKNHGKLILVGMPDQPLELPAPYLATGNKAVLGSFIGGMKSMQEMLDFAGKHNITADIEVVPMNYVNTAMERLSKSDVRYRFVLDIANTIKVKD